MEAREREEILLELASGRTSRNRAFQRFDAPGARRVLQGFRRVEILAREAACLDAEVRVIRGMGGRIHAVIVERPRLGYRRRMNLLDWEADFLARRHPWVGGVPS